MTPPPISKGSWQWIGTVAKPEMPCYLRSSDPEECWVGVALDGFTDNPANAQAIAALPQLLSALEFYANPENWREQETGIGMVPSECEDDYGAKATAALLAAGYTE